MANKLDSLTIFTLGQNYLHLRSQARTFTNPISHQSFADSAAYAWDELYELSRQVERAIAMTSKQMALRAASIAPGSWQDLENYEYNRYHDLERELDRLEYLQDDLKAYLDGHKPNEVDPVEKAKAEFLALATRARVSAASRRFVERKARGSYDGDVVKALIERKVATEPRHAIHVLNLSKGLCEGWSNEELLYWALCYRKARENGEDKLVAVAVANKALTVGS